MGRASGPSSPREHQMDFKQLRAFLTVADTGNVTRAAELLNLVQPAVSRQLRLLEEDLGTELFERERHGMVLNEHGKALLVYARRAMLELDRARAEIGGTTAREIGGLVTVGLLPSTSDLLATALVSEVRKRHPRIRVRIAMGYAGTLQQWLEAGDIDIALLYGAERLPNIEAQALLEEALWVVGPPAAKLKANKPVPLAALAGKPLVLPSGPHGIRTLVDHACAVAKVELTIVAETNAMSIQKSLVLGGHGLTILPPIACAEELARREVSAAPLSEPQITRTIVLALPARRVIGRHVRVTADLLAGCAKDAVLQRRWPEATWLAA
jgi:LysR family transcriptional regulator, nitrogen assimilation regulatory protein